MGIDKDGLVFLEACRHFIKSADSIMTIGRLKVYAPKQIIREHSPNLKVGISSVEYLDELLRLDFDCRVDSLDLSDYQGATILHDLNSPVPPELKHRFDLIVESGTLEHIMDFKQAAESLGAMTKVGGYLAIITPTNGYVGHGFFQINPDFFYSFFSPGNGFEVVACLMKFSGSRTWLHHPNPVEDIGFRAEFRSRRYIRTFLLIKKVDASQFQVTNSFDYEKIWQAGEEGISWKGKLYNRTPPLIQRFLRFINDIRVRRAIFKELTRIRSKNLPSFIKNR